MQKVITHMTADNLAKIAEVIKAIGHPVRIQIIEVLRSYPKVTVSDIQHLIREEIEQSLLSHHLIKMKDKGILVSQKEGTQVYYALSNKDFIKLLACMESCSCHF